MKYRKFDSIVESVAYEINKQFSNVKHPKISSFAFLKRLILIDESIINECRDVFKTVGFLNVLTMFEDLMTFNAFDKNEVNSKLNLKADYQFFVFKYDFHDFGALQKCFKQLNVKDTDENDRFIFNTFKDLSNSYPAGAFVAGEDDFGMKFFIMFLNEMKYDEDTIKHEFIHYFQLVDDNGLVKNERYLNVNDKNETFGLISKENLQKIFSKKEIIQYIHNICYVFEKHGVDSVSKAFMIIHKISALFNDDPIEFIEKAKKLEEYKWFENCEIPFNMLLLSIIYKRNMTIFNMTIARYFK